LPNLIRAARYQPEVWDAAAPVPFDAGQIGIKGSPTIVGKAFTPSPKEPGELVHVAEAGLVAAVSTALARIAASGAVEALVAPARANGGAQ
jgi:electron transfer flavoprotein beta subunit